MDPRFEELLVLRNRVAHGRLLTDAEAKRVQVLTRELRVMLGLRGDPDRLTFEDPISTFLDARGYFEEAVENLRQASPPKTPTALTALLSSSAGQEALAPGEFSDIRTAANWLGAQSQIRRTPGYRLAARKELENPDKALLVARVSGILRRLIGGST
jgi:hypothetical protein